MTVEELIEELSMFPPDCIVVDPTFSEIETVREDSQVDYSSHWQPVIMII